jgi:hypothetical protein
MQRGETRARYMDLSVVIVNWNTRELLLQCLRHLDGLLLGLDTEVWVVDNGSADGSPRAVRSAFPGVRLIENARNLGFAAANNQALRACGGRYALLLNSDCFPRPGAIEGLVSAVQRDSRVGIAGGALSDPDGRPQNAFGAAPTLATELLPRGILQTLFPRRYPSKRHPPRDVMEVESVLGAFLLARREAWQEVGGLDEGYFLFMEETDWCVRMRRRGWKVVHVPWAVATHLQGQSARNDLAGARVEYHRSRYRFFSLHRSQIALAFLRGGILVKCLSNWTSSGLMMRMSRSAEARWSRRHEVDRHILRWHLQGCPGHWGMSRGPESEQGGG